MSAPTTASMDREAARELAAKFVGSWEGTGTVDPCCTGQNWYNIYPLNAEGRYIMQGYMRVRLCGFCPIARVTLKGEAEADGMTFTRYTRNANKAEFEPGGGPTTFRGTLTSIDAAQLKATYKVQGSGPAGAVSGTYVMDGRNMTETVERTGGQGGMITMRNRKVSDEVKDITCCGISMG